MNEAALAEVIATIDELERLFAQAQDDPRSPAWLAMRRKLGDLQEAVKRLQPRH